MWLESRLGIRFTFDYFLANAHVMLCRSGLDPFMNPRCISHRFQKIITLETDSLETINEISMSVREMGSGIIVAYAGCIIVCVSFFFQAGILLM